MLQVVMKTLLRTFRRTLTRYGSRIASSKSSASGVKRNRCILIIARTQSIANWNFFLALNWLCRRSCCVCNSSNIQVNVFQWGRDFIKIFGNQRIERRRKRKIKRKKQNISDWSYVMKIDSCRREIWMNWSRVNKNQLHIAVL